MIHGRGSEYSTAADGDPVRAPVASREPGARPQQRTAQKDPVTARKGQKFSQNQTKPQEQAQKMRKLQLGAVGPSRSPVEAGRLSRGLLTTRRSQVACTCAECSPDQAPENGRRSALYARAWVLTLSPGGSGPAGRKNPIKFFLAF